MFEVSIEHTFAAGHAFKAEPAGGSAVAIQLQRQRGVTTVRSSVIAKCEKWLPSL